MSDFNRRKFLESSAGVAAVASVGAGSAIRLLPDPLRAHLFDQAAGRRLAA